MSYEYFRTINEKRFTHKKVLLLGAGWMARQYMKAFVELDITNIDVVTRSQQSAEAIHREYGVKALAGGFADMLPRLENNYDLLIVALPVHLLCEAAEIAIQRGFKNILIEKPASLFSHRLESIWEKINNLPVNVKIAYNRSFYPNLWLLKEAVEKDGGITSCHYTFTEWIHTIDFSKDVNETYARWGIANSLHVIHMAHSLIGMPRNFMAYRTGSLPWHPSGSQFVGAGVTVLDIPFSYHANWESAGRWGIDVMTRKRAYRLMPLEELMVCPIGRVQWEKIPFETAFPALKPGIAEEICFMLDSNHGIEIRAADIDWNLEIVRFVESALGYPG